jgi:hypothetical protein
MYLPYDTESYSHMALLETWEEKEVIKIIRGKISIVLLLSLSKPYQLIRI